MSLSQQVESYTFWDVVTLWARESLEHEEIVSRALARGIVQDGLRFQSIDPRWAKNEELDFNGDPYVGFVAKPGQQMVVLRAEALEHLLTIVRTAKKPSRKKLKEEFVLKEDFKKWIKQTGQQLPSFWFSDKDG